VRVLGLIAAIAGSVTAVVMFVSGYTRSTATVVVALRDPAVSLADDRIGDVSSVGTTAKFFFSDIQGGDRTANHLGVVVLCLVLAAIGFALAGQARAGADHGSPWLLTRTRYSAVLGWSVVALGVFPPLAENAAANAVLTAAGSPPGVSAVGGIDPTWVIIGLGYLLSVRAVLRGTRACDPHEPLATQANR
jgi:hypothetical protein